MRTKPATLLFTFCLFYSTPAPGVEPGWSEVGGEEEITIAVNQQDGTTRELTIWLAVVDGQGYIRTWDTDWRTEIERDPNVSLSIAGRDYPVRVSAVADRELFDRVNAAFTKKYGMMRSVGLAVMRPFLGSWHIYRADRRELDGSN